MVARIAGIFEDPVGLSGCNRLAIYYAWGPTLQQAHPAFKDYSCSYCKRIASTSNVTLGNNPATGMASRIGVTINTAALPAGTNMTDLQAEPVTPFAPVLFAPAAGSALKAASGNLPSTGNWTLSFTLVKGDQTERCPLPEQSISCMPTFIRTPSGGCECRPGYQNTNGNCTAIPTACDTVVMSLTAVDSAPRGMANSIITASISQQPPGVAAKVVAVPKNSTVDVAPNVPATLPATGDWSITLSVGDQLCTSKTQLVTVGCAAGFDEVNGQCSCPLSSENVGGKCVANLCAKANPQFSLAASNATGAVSTLRVSVSSDLPINTIVELLAVPQNAAVKVPPFQPASPGSVVLTSTGSWNMQLSVDGKPCAGLPPLTVTCLPGFVGTPSGGCECPIGMKNTDGKCEPITDKPKTACEVATFLPSVTQLTDNATVSLNFSDGRDRSQVSVLMRPKVAVRTAPASNTSALLGLGRVVPGEYEIELEEGGSRCTLSSSVSVGCSPGYSPAGGVGGVCTLTNTTCRADEWIYGTSCLRKAEMTVQASSTVLEITVVKSRNTTIRTATAELRLKSGDVKYDTNGHRIKWTARKASDASDASWLTLHSSTGFVHSGKPVADVVVIVDSAGFNDTAQSGPLITTITFRCEAEGPGMTNSDFANGTEMRTIEVHLTVIAVPYVTDSHVVVTSSASGGIVRPGEPIEAGDRLTVAVKAVDADGLPISRRDLQLAVEVRGKLNRGRHSAPLEPITAGANVYTATIPENWIKEPETVESGVLRTTRFRFLASRPCHVCSIWLDRLACCDPRSSGLSSCRACPASPRTSRSLGRSQSWSRTTSL
jgi:hypothetical protein